MLERERERGGERERESKGKREGERWRERLDRDIIWCDNDTAVKLTEPQPSVLFMDNFIMLGY